MNVTVYLLGKLGKNYTQYPDDYTRDIFTEFDKNITSRTQLIIYRKDTLIYYTYLHPLSENGKYIGIAIVLNGIMCSDIHSIFKLCEDIVTTMAVNGDILEFADNGDIVSKVDKLYKTAYWYRCAISVWRNFK